MALKEEVLAYLEYNRDKAVSGERLALELGVSRAAIWKAVKRLRTDGHGIVAVPNRGYRLEPGSDLLTCEGVRCRLLPAYQDCVIRVEDCVDSTNTLAKKLAADGAASGTIVLAEAQSNGLGRLGRSFYSPARTGLYMSLLLRPKVESAQLPLLTIAAAVSVCEALQQTVGMDFDIKWVNDIFLGGKKICGILTEAVSDCESGATESAVVGIGINVATPECVFPLALQKIAGSLLPLSVSRIELAAEIVNRLLDYAARLPQRPFLDFYRHHVMALGQPIRYRQGDIWYAGVAAGIDDEGRLLVDTGGGRVILRAGEIKLREEPT